MLYDTSQYSNSSALMTEEAYDYEEDDNVNLKNFFKELELKFYPVRNN